MIQGIKKIILASLMLLVSAAGTARAEVFTYTDATAYLNGLASFGYSSFSESFEDNAIWGGVRSPNTSSSVTSQGIDWTSNHPGTNDITTGMGAAVTGEWGIYDRLHGVATGTELECDVDNPPAECLYHDGVSGTWGIEGSSLYGIGGWFSGTSGAGIEFILDQNRIKVGKLGIPAQQPQFFGVIETTGFLSYKVRETNGKVGDEKFIFADDFTFASSISTPCVPTGFADDNCDGVDDDCSGVADDGYVPESSCGVGLCLTNNIPSSCVDGVEILCNPGVPVPENTDPVCIDGLDNNCDGLVDGADPGCAPAIPIPCVPTGFPDDNCDGVDDDCDGLIDTAGSGCLEKKKFPWILYLPAFLGTGADRGK